MSQAIAPYSEDFNGIVAGGDNSAITANWDQYSFGAETTDTDIWNGWSLNPGLVQDTANAYTLYHADDDTADDLSGVDDWFVLHLDCSQLVEPLFSYVEYQTYQDTWYVFHGVYYSEDYNPGGSSGASQPNGTWVELIQGSATTTPTIRDFSIPTTATAVAFRFTGDYADNWLIDDVSIIEGFDLCPTPAITEWTMNNNSVDFDGTNNSEVSGYQIEYSTAEFTPGDGTATIYEFDSFPNSLTGLEPSTIYYFAIRSNCGDNSYSNWTGAPDVYITECAQEVHSLPYANDFEDFGAWVSCNAFIDTDLDGNFWVNANYDTDEDGIGDDRCAASFSWDSSAGPLTPDNWFIVGPIDLTSVTDATMSWNARGADPAWCAENYTVYVGTDATTENLLASSIFYNETIVSGGDACGAWGDRSFDISAASGTLAYIGFRHHNVSNLFVLNIDNLSVTSESLGVNNINEVEVNYNYNKTTKVVTINSPNILLSNLIVYNVLGQVVTQKSSNRNSETINMSSFGKGVYIVKVFSENGSNTIRLINN